MYDPQPRCCPLLTLYAETAIAIIIIMVQQMIIVCKIQGVKIVFIIIFLYFVHIIVFMNR